jgi:uncharacterized protein YciI
MKKAFLTMLFFGAFFFAKAQNTFDVTIEGQTYHMKEYFVVFLKAGPNRATLDPKEAERLQPLHLAHLGTLAKEGIIVLNGPFGDDTELRGMSIYSVPSLEDAMRHASDDPMVKAGWLAVEVHPWYGAVGTCLK